MHGSRTFSKEGRGSGIRTADLKIQLAKKKKKKKGETEKADKRLTVFGQFKSFLVDFSVPISSYINVLVNHCLDPI